MPITLIQNPEDLQLNDQQELNQILGNPPGWILYWGITLLFVATILFGILAWIIKYPDVIKANVIILTENPAIRLIPMVSGRLEKLLVQNQQKVEKNDLLAILESSVDFEDVLALEEWLLKLESTKKSADYHSFSANSKLNIGNLQAQYAKLVQQLTDLQYHLHQKSNLSKIGILEDQIDHTIALNNSLKKQQKTLAKEVALAQKNWKRNQQLNIEGIVSNVDLEQIETAYLRQKRQLDNFETQIISNLMKEEQFQGHIVDYEQSSQDNINTRKLAVKETLQSLQSQIAIWKKNYLVMAPISGRVSLSKVWTVNQFVRQGEELLTIVPLKDTGKILAKARVPIESSGKVRIGQTVNIKLNGFPFQEYGILKSEVRQIALVPEGDEDRYYELALNLPDSLYTTYDKKIPLRQEMSGTAEIITEEKRILYRVFEQILSILKNH